MRAPIHSISTDAGSLNSDIKHVSGYREHVAATQFKQKVLGLAAVFLILAALGLAGTVELSNSITEVPNGTSSK